MQNVIRKYFLYFQHSSNCKHSKHAVQPFSTQQNSHMDDFTQPQQKFAAAGENCNFVIASIFTLSKEHFDIFCAYYLGL